MVCLVGLQAVQARFPSGSLLGGTPGEGDDSRPPGSRVGGPSQVGTAERGWGGRGRRGRMRRRGRVLGGFEGLTGPPGTQRLDTVTEGGTEGVNGRGGEPACGWAAVGKS